MSSKAHICNLALAHIGHAGTTISNLDTDSNATARQCRVHYDVARKFVLADFNWSFARRDIALVDVGSPPATWKYRYKQPNNMLAFRYIQGDTRTSSPEKHEVRMKSDETAIEIFSDRPSAIGIYTYDAQNPAIFPPGFVSALSWYLASELAVAIAKDFNKQGACLKVYQALLASAQLQDSKQTSSEEFQLAPWDEVR